MRQPGRPPAPPAAVADDDVGRAIGRGLANLTRLQRDDGGWRGRYGGPMFLLPMYVIAREIAGDRPGGALRDEIVASLRRSRRDDGAVGLHAEGAGSMFTTVLGYVALRLLGVGPDDAGASAMRRWIIGHGTALGAASWGKFMLALLNLYPYEGLHPVLPELWLLPPAAPFHPSRLWCHTRQVYLPMALLYGMRAALPVNELTRRLRTEIYDRPWDEIRFREHRATVSPADDIVPATSLLRAVNAAMGVYERFHPGRVRRRAMEEVFAHLAYEDRVTHDIDIGPVNSVLNAIAHHFRDPGGEEEKRGYAALEQYVWREGGEAIFNGYNSTALWDTAFAVRAILAAGTPRAHAEALARAYGFIRDSQVIEDLPDARAHYRHPSKGGWPFSDRAHGWPISDCTGEALACAVALEPLVDAPIPGELLAESVRVILSMQNGDGGWATYERRRGGRWLELLNPSQVFRDIMIDYSYPECTASCIQGLAAASRRFPGRFGRALPRAVRAGTRFLRRSQRPDGSWEGSWGVCFTYGTWFATEGLRAAGAPPDAPELQRAARFLVERQNRDGGWGESHLGCSERRWVPAGESRAVNTAWALLTLVNAGGARTEPARMAARFLVSRQDDDGGWPREPMVGVFNKTVLIDYDNYRHYFPLRALAHARAARG